MIISLLVLALAVRLGYHMVIKSEEYAIKAVRQQTSDSVVSAVRGSILDRNGSELAISVTSYTVWVRPGIVTSNGEDEDEIKANIRSEALLLSEILEMDYDAVYDIITAEKVLIKLAQNVDMETAAELREQRLAGIEINEMASRYYPLDSFCCHVIGNVNIDNAGFSGLELYYNNTLQGLDGRWVTNKDNKRNALAYGTSRYFAANDGRILVSTIDENIQYIVEQRLAECQEATQSERVMCLIMDPGTGEILAMAQTPKYDLNFPRAPISEEDEALMSLMTDEEKVEHWNRLWRNFNICDVYEPGSTFKLITTAIALDNDVTYPGETFYCSSQEVADWTLKCWYHPRSHGTQTLAEAVKNSCNPVMMQLVRRIGLRAYFAGIDAFGLNERTGVDFPAEGGNILQSINTAGPVGLATMSYGQGIAVTPVSLLTAICAIGNDGLLMQPHLVKAVLDPDGNVIETIEPEIKSRPISAQTAAEVLSIMETVVSEGSASTAAVSGYRIGGKTGTANKPEGGAYSETDVYGSFVGIAPIDDPKIAILVLCDTPKGILYGSQTAGPCAGAIMSDIFRYLNIAPKYSEAELAAIDADKLVVPDLVERSVDDAIAELSAIGLEYILTPPPPTSAVVMVVTDQYPRGGEEVSKGAAVTLYYEIIATEDEYIGVDVTENEDASHIPED